MTGDRKLLEVELEEIEYRLYMENPEREDRIKLKDRQAEIEDRLGAMNKENRAKQEHDANWIRVERGRLERAIAKYKHQIAICTDGERIDYLDNQLRVLERKLRESPIVVNDKVYPGGGNTPVFDNSTKQGREVEAMNVFLGEVFDECFRATSLHGPMNSLHEGYAVILEEVDELWDQVKLKASKRDPKNLHTELVQIAAMALKTAVNLKL